MSALKRSHLYTGWSCCILLLTVAGCEVNNDAQFSQLRQEILSDQLPSDVGSLEDALATFEEGMGVRVVGRIFADKMSPFDAETAAFNLIELPKPGHNHDDPGDCPFCKRDMENAAKAVVHVLDSKGQEVPTSAQQLLLLEKNQDVVVEGSASKVGDLLIVNATSVHVLNDEDAQHLAKQVHGKTGD